MAHVSSYLLTGTFIESCDCTVICPCWVDDEPDEDHCTGMVAWTLEPGSTIDGVSVAARTVVSVSTHSGSRGRNATSSVLFVDSGATPEQRDKLLLAFAGDAPGSLADLAGVTGDVMLTQQADVSVTHGPDKQWTITVSIDSGSGAARLVSAGGKPKLFDSRADPLTLANTALDSELRIRGTVTAQVAESISVAVPALPGGYIDVTARSGMTGAFRYEHLRDGNGDDDRD